MGEFDLSQALDSSSESDEVETKSCCSDMNDMFFKLDEGLNLVVSHNQKTMCHVANLVLAVNRMKKALTSCRELSDEQLCSDIMGSLVEEKIVKTEENVTTGEKKYVFLRVNSVRQCTLCDTSKKDIVYTSEKLKLQAITLQGGHGEHKVNFKLSRYIHPSVADAGTQTVVLSITNNLHISSSMNDSKATLNLEECSEEDLQKITDDGDMDRFLFYKSTKGKSMTTFESVKCRGWFISTSSEGESVEMCEMSAARVKCFQVMNTN